MGWRATWEPSICNSSSAPSPRHQTVVGNLFAWLRQHVAVRQLGRVYLSPVDVVLSRFDVVQPDLVFVRAERLGIVTDSGIPEPPDLCE